MNILPVISWVSVGKQLRSERSKGKECRHEAPVRAFTYSMKAAKTPLRFAAVKAAAARRRPSNGGFRPNPSKTLRTRRRVDPAIPPRSPFASFLTLPKRSFQFLVAARVGLRLFQRHANDSRRGLRRTIVFSGSFLPNTYWRYEVGCNQGIH